MIHKIFLRISMSHIIDSKLNHNELKNTKFNYYRNVSITRVKSKPQRHPKTRIPPKSNYIELINIKSRN